MTITPNTLCSNCGTAPATRTLGDGSPSCQPCYVAGLQHGHIHIGHDAPVADCPNCDRCYGYTVDQHGMIVSPGKFEGEYMDAPFWHAQSLLGADDEYDGYALIKVTDDDRAIWPELRAEVFGVVITESDQGFVRCQHVTAGMYRQLCAQLDADQADQAENDE